MSGLKLPSFKNIAIISLLLEHGSYFCFRFIMRTIIIVCSVEISAYPHEFGKRGFFLLQVICSWVNNRSKFSYCILSYWVILFSITTFKYYKTGSVTRSNHIFSLIKIRNRNSRSNVRNNIYIDQLICKRRLFNI